MKRFMKKPLKINSIQFQIKMKKIIATMTVCLVLFSCSTQKSSDEKPPLYEILKQEEQGGANFRFFEIVTEQKEFKMLLNDKDLKRKINPSDINTCNFLLLNMGEKNSGGYSFSVENIEETENDIIITIKENGPKGIATTMMTYPLSIVKINSKKNIIIK
jgi:hypothetical protein